MQTATAAETSNALREDAVGLLHGVCLNAGLLYLMLTNMARLSGGDYLLNWVIPLGSGCLDSAIGSCAGTVRCCIGTLRTC